jgi:NAD+ kinase
MPKPGSKPGEESSGSVGALCACSSQDMKTILPRVLFRDMLPRARTRLLLTVSSTYNNTTLPPALNDVLLAHPSPAAMSRFSVCGNLGSPPTSSILPSNDPNMKVGDAFSMNSRSSGLWISTATGSTGAMAAAGGLKMHKDSGSLQWRIRDEAPRAASDSSTMITTGFVDHDGHLRVRWNSHKGVAYIDGHYVIFELELGDELNISAKASPIFLF